MKWLLLVLILNLVGCVTPLAEEAIDVADKRIRLRWAEEWKPSLKNELSNALGESQNLVLERALSELEKQEGRIETRLSEIGFHIEDFDEDKDGFVTDAEAIKMVGELRSATDAQGNPLGWYEILMAVILGYGGTTAGKEWIRSKVKKGTGDGTKST